jgi:type IV secretion system protein VirB1
MDTPVDVSAYIETCAPTHIARETVAMIIKTESSGNPWAIGVVGGRLVRQPATKEEAVVTAEALKEQGWNYSVGAMQINQSNFARYGLTLSQAFDICENIRVGSAILKECYDRALPKYESEQVALRAALSCYYSGNFSTGFAHGYVKKSLKNAGIPQKD